MQYCSKRGFTIVELLIVIVVIAILASITIVAYNGIRQRAENNTIVDAASKASRLIQSYVVANNSHPAVTNLCISVDSGCGNGGAFPTNAGFNTNMATIGTLPKSVPVSGATRYGMVYYYNVSRVVDGLARPIAIVYWLRGVAQPCVLSGLLADANALSTTITTSLYTAANDSGSGNTLCALSVPS